MHLLSTLRVRIGRADALVMDLAGHNPNVLIEVGMAVAMRKGVSGALIILKPKNEPWPSNLQGIVYCNYDKSLRRGLEDQAGFHAALRTRILNVAEERGMIACPGDSHEIRGTYVALQKIPMLESSSPKGGRMAGLSLLSQAESNFKAGKYRS